MKLFPGLFYGAGGLCFCAVVSARAAIFTVTTTADNGPGSLRASIAAASSGDAIVFSSSLAGQTIQLTGGQLSIGQNLTIDASALANGIIINGGGNGRVLEIGGSGFVELDGLTLTNGYGNGGTGAGVFLDNTTCGLTANHCVFSGNFGAEYGGGIYTYGTLTLNNCIVYGNTADVFGGGIFGYGSAITLNNCRLLANLVSNGGGGGIESELTTLRLNGCVISNNFSPFFGGGLDSDDDGSLAATNCVFADNTSGTGGAISVETPATTAILSDCTFCDNISTNGAGGGMVNYGSLALINCLFSGNSVTNSNGLGGGLVNSGIAT
ncbi:MAG TPA: hypothetical protein VGV18_04165, partial [Verrucomicrobiae bacterium]|nr:hypothetical protein [Verrucomicrobiae bacterium]